jgi:hypothetical protein
MLKIFILGQMETRKEKNVYYLSLSEKHGEELSQFVSRNESKFCRDVKELNLEEEKRVASEGADMILDEELYGSLALSCLSSQYKDQIVAVVCTGAWGNTTSRNFIDKSIIDAKKFFKSGEMKKFFESGEMTKLLESGRMTKLFESGKMTHFFESGYVRKLLESGYMRKFFESIDMNKFFESGEMTKIIESGETRKFFESGEMRKFFESGGMSKFLEAGEMKKLLESGEMSKFFESGEMSKFFESGEMKKLHESGEMTKLLESGEVTKFFESIDMKKFFESGCMTKFVKSGSMTKSLESFGTSELFESIDVKKFESLDFQITELETIFRSTRQIQKFFHKFIPNENKEELISGHNFDGIKVEEWIFDDEEQLKKALNERILRLIQIEGCKEGEIGLFQPCKFGKPQLINNIFHNSINLRSLEFPVMIVVDPNKSEIYLCLSRAICHLIVFTVIDLD